jgi:hypothetical protein
MLEGSWILAPWSVAYLKILVEAIGSASWEGLEVWVDGRRKGRAPVGEAWLLEETSLWSMPAMLRKVWRDC